MSSMTRYRGPRIRATKSPYQYPYQQYPYQNVGTQLTWRDSPPFQTRAAPGSLGGYLPAPGSPEQIPIESGYSGYIEDKGLAGCGCGCAGKGGCNKPMGAFSDLISWPPNPVYVAIGVGALFLIARAMKK